MLRIGIDTGGTFTDFSVFDEDSGHVCLTFKTPSQPDNPLEAIAQGIAEIRSRLAGQVNYLLHGTTIGLNTLLEGREPAPALMVTEGFRDILELDRQWRGDQVYNLFFDRPRRLVPRRLIYPVSERVDAGGVEIIPLDTGQAHEWAEQLAHSGVRSVAISLLFSFANPGHEQALGKILRQRNPDLYLSLSSDVDPQFREFERTSTTVVNAFIGPRVSGYVGAMEARVTSVFDGARVLVMQSNGGVATPAMIARTPVQTLMSGPVAGVVGAKRLGEQIGRSDLISLDIGGTSCDMSVIPGEILLAPQSQVASYTVRAATVDIATIGSGGGSIARVESGRILKVGPQSAGAAPGPACYGHGDQPTLTDALVALGHLSQKALLAGTMPIDAVASREAIASQIAKPLDMTTEQAAAGILEILAAQVAASMRSATIEKGYDPRDFTLVTYGGAGPTVACAIALELEIPDLCIPQDPGNFCAAGMLHTDLVRNYARTQISLLDQTTPEELSAVLADLENTGIRELEAQSLSQGSVTTEYLLDMRYLGQSYEVTVAVQDLRKEHLTQAFHEAHGRLFGHTAEQEPIEIVSYRVRCTGRLSEFTATTLAPTSDSSTEPRDHRSMRFPGEKEAASVPIYERTQLRPGFETPGPTVIEEYSSTTVVYPGFRVSVDAYGNLILTSHR